MIDGPAIRYTGAQSTACSPNPALPQTAYRASPATIQGDAASVAASNSIFQALKGSPAGVGKAEQIRSCTITREVSLNAVKADDVIAHLGGAYAIYAPAPDQLTLQMGSPRDDSLRGGSCRIFEFSMRLRIDDPDRLAQFRLSHYFFDDWLQLRIDGELVLSNPANWTGTGLPPGKCERKRTWHAYPNLDLKPWLTRGEHVISMRIAVGGEGEAFAQFDAMLDLRCNPTERIVDLCAGYAGDVNCALHDESVDGVETFRNGVGTGLTPLPQARLFESGACSLRLARPWFERQRRYRCTVDTGSMPEPDLSRGAYIIDHSTETMLADRTRTSDGVMPPRHGPSRCPIAARFRPASRSARPARPRAIRRLPSTEWSARNRMRLSGGTPSTMPARRQAAAMSALWVRARKSSRPAAASTIFPKPSS